MQPPRPPKGIRSPPATATSMRRDGKGFRRPSQHVAKGQQSTSPESAVADQFGYEPLKIYQSDSEVGQVCMCTQQLFIIMPQSISTSAAELPLIC